jgi:hypothetical protein
VGGLATSAASKSEDAVTDFAGTEWHERAKPRWTGYDDFRAFKQHGMVDLVVMKDQDAGTITTDIVRSEEDAAKWRQQHIRHAKLVELGYAYRQGGKTIIRSEVEAARWRVEKSEDDERRLAEEHFLAVLEDFRGGSHQGNIWQSSRAASSES